MKNMIIILSFLFLFSGCSGKKAYEMAIDFGRYQSNLTLKQTSISEDLNISYLQNSIQSDKTLVLIHGFGANKDNWLKLAKELDDRYQLIIPDLIGDGDSSKPLTIEYSIQNQTQMLHKFLTKFPDKDLVLIGNSMGGQIAINYAYEHHIDSLVLIDSMGLKVEDSYIDKLGAKKLEEMYLNVCSIEKMQKMVDLGFSKPPYIPNFILEHLTQEKCKVSKLDKRKYGGIINKDLDLLDDMTEKSKKIDIPTLILWGEEDKIISVKNAYAFKKYILNSKVIVFKGIGHMPMLEAPVLSAKSIRIFLEK